MTDLLKISDTLFHIDYKDRTVTIQNVSTDGGQKWKWSIIGGAGSGYPGFPTRRKALNDVKKFIDSRNVIVPVSYNGQVDLIISMFGKHYIEKGKTGIDFLREGLGYFNVRNEIFNENKSPVALLADWATRIKEEGHTRF